MKLKAQAPQVRVDCIAKSPDVEDTFVAIFARHSRDDGIKLTNELNAMTKRGEKDAEYEALISKHCIGLEITDAEGVLRKFKDPDKLSDALKALFNSTPYFLGLIDGLRQSFSNQKAEDSRLGNFESLVASLLGSSKTSTKPH